MGKDLAVLNYPGKDHALLYGKHLAILNYTGKNLAVLTYTSKIHQCYMGPNQL